MPQFAYVARDATGAVVEGDLSAVNPSEAARILRTEGKYLLKLNAAAATERAAAPAAWSRGKYRPDDVIYFASQLTVMVDTGVSLADALDACRSSTNSPVFARALDDVIEQVEGGSEFSKALAAQPRVFSPLFVSMVRASEASGTLGMMLQRITDFLVRQRDLKKKIMGAVTYPIAMLCFAAGVTIFLLTYVLPKFAAIYAGKEAALPAATRYLMAFATWLTSYGLYVLGALAVLVAVAVVQLRRPSGRRVADALKLHTPLLGSMFHKTYLARSLRTLGTMIQTGVSMLEAVELTRNACGNSYYETMWDAAHEELKQGKQLSDTLGDSPLVPRPIIQMIRAGERSGRLGAVLERVSDFCESELSAAIKTMTAMIEPIIIGVLGTVVGGLVIALLLPIFTISRAMHP